MGLASRGYESNRAAARAYHEVRGAAVCREAGIAFEHPDTADGSRLLSQMDKEGVLVECLPLSGRWHKKHCRLARRDLAVLGRRGACLECPFNGGRFGHGDND